MAKKAPRLRGKPENPRKFKKKTSPLIIDKVEYVDYKDIELLSRFMSDRAKIRNMRVTGNDRQQQLEIANAIKIAREMALLPYAKRVASSGRGRPSRDDRRGGGDREGRHNGDADLELDMTLEGDVDVDVEIDDVDDVDVTIEETMETPA